MNNLEKIKSLNKEQMAKFLLSIEYQEIVPKYVYCDETYCACCKDNLKCFIDWLEAEYDTTR